MVVIVSIFVPDGKQLIICRPNSIKIIWVSSDVHVGMNTVSSAKRNKRVSEVLDQGSETQYSLAVFDVQLERLKSNPQIGNSLILDATLVAQYETEPEA